MEILAMNGGPKTYAGNIETPWPVSSKHDLDGLFAVLEQSVQGKNGPIAKKFEKRFAEYNEVKHCILCANGTTAIELILRGLGIGYGDEVIMPPYTFIASVSAVIYAGVKPVFADIDADTVSLSAESVRSKITPRTKAIMPVFIGGRPTDMDALTELAKETGLYLICDAAQAVGAEWKGKSIGSFGIAASYSLQNTKNLNCGEGGAITTNDDALAAELRTLINGGMDKDGNYTHIGGNHNISEWQASMLYTQMDKLEEETALRNENAAYLDSLLAPIPCVSSMAADDRITRNAYHLYVIRVHEEHLKGVPRERFLDAIYDEGIAISHGYMPLYDFPCVNGDYAAKSVGGKIDNSKLAAVEKSSHHESAWLLQSTMLNSKPAVKAIADAIKKVYENIDELIEIEEEA
jgi:dTDP-4-amino-4,6-dideoxygalactose transaminase